jgi:tRNA nucleotidyltransferase (CCA-adding enzyme)
LEKIDKVCSRVKKRIVPTPQLRRMVEQKSEEIRRAVQEQCAKDHLEAEVRLDGSVAKDTWVRGYEEVDIFMRVSPRLTKEQLRQVCLPTAKRALRPNVSIERFAEHPYIESAVKFDSGHLKVNVVPCYNVERGNWLSATDRTPYHTAYVRERMTNQERDEVRLLKAFMRGIGAYGADIKTGGFSGMLCETLILAYESFRDVGKEFAQWRAEGYIDVENYYAGRASEVHRIFREPLVVIDPVDKGRNVAAAVRPEQLWNFVSACRHLVNHPSTTMFSEPKVAPLTKIEFRRLLRARGSTLLCVVTGRINAVVDILWSQLYRTERALLHHLENNDFTPIRTASWSDEKNLSLVLFEVETDPLPRSRKHLGPPVARAAESASFLAKHQRNAETVSGPWVENDRWVVQKKRPTVSARQLLLLGIRSGGKEIGVAPLLARSFRRSALVLTNDEIGQLISNNLEFARFMRTYLSGRPAWLG